MEEMTLEYREVDGLLYPQISLPQGQDEELAALGRYGRMAMRYLKENEPARYKSLYRFGRLSQKMKEVEDEANGLMERLTAEYLKKHRPQNPDSTMEAWQLRERARRQAEETVLHQVVMKYH